MSRRWLVRILKAVGAIATLVALLNILAFEVVLARDALPADAAPHAGKALADLPLVEVAPKGRPASDVLFVYLTGDNGWRDGDVAFTHGIIASGAPVVVLDSLHYFVWGRTPERAAADLARVIEHYSAVWGTRRVVLVGYSYGANVIPVLARRLPPDLRAKVSLIALIAPVAHAELTLRPYSLIDITGPGAYSVASELGKLQNIPAICIYGANDRRAACRRLPAKPVTVPGGHRFEGQRGAVARIIVEAAGQRASQP
jgi:type IV secretory pathway VirJ component